MPQPYKEQYALIFDSHGLFPDEHDTLQRYIKHLEEMVNQFTPYRSFVDDKYSDDVQEWPRGVAWTDHSPQPPAEFATEQEAIDYAKDNIKGPWRVVPTSPSEESK